MSNHPSKKDVRDYYDVVYHPRNLPDRLPSRNYKMFLSSLSADIPREARVLDIGCGPGFFLQTAETFGYRAFGVDISQSALSQARMNIRDENLVLADGEFLPFRSESFDLVVSYGSIEHFEYPENGLAEIARIVKQGGTVRVSVPNSKFWPQRIGLFGGTGQILEESYTLEEWTRMIVDNRMVIESIGKDYGPPIFKNFRIAGILRRILLKLSCLAPLRYNYQFIFVMSRE